MKKGAFDRIAERSPKDSKIFVSKSLDIVERIHAILEKKQMSQTDLANALSKSPSEINKWLSGTHNFTLKSIAKLEMVLDEPIIVISQKPLKKKLASSAKARNTAI